MTIEEATDGDIILAYGEQVLCPALRLGDVVIMDNLSAHKVAGVRELIQATGAEWLYLPPYSPDLNPIEKAWAKLTLLRALKARTAEALERALAQVLPSITPDNAQAWFRHCADELYTPGENALDASVSEPDKTRAEFEIDTSSQKEGR